MTLRDRWTRTLRRMQGSTIDYSLASSRSHLQKINALEPEMQQSSDADLKQQAAMLQTQIIKYPTDTRLIVRFYALVRDAARRTVGMRPFDVQILGALAMQDGRLAEMQTGEGKTLAAVFPAAWHALFANGVHILTFNDYLARRDAQWMRPIYEFIGLSVGFVQESMETDKRQAAYDCDITYVTAKQAGFDYLRDSLCYDKKVVVQRPFYAAIVDEADSILLDEARIPLVIAGSAEDILTDSYFAAQVAGRMESGVDFEFDEYARNIYLTDQGQRSAETLFKCSNLYAAENLDSLTRLHNALHAEHLLKRDVDYIVRGGAIELVDEFTGRVADQRRWPDGLQSALEAKEHINIRSKGNILNQISLQHFIRFYPRLCGMTATALSSEEEFKAFYNLNIAVIPPNAACIRRDSPDTVFRNQSEKNRAIIEEIVRVNASQRPVLVGTSSVQESEKLATALVDRDVNCQILNAKYDDYEAEMIAEAGRPCAVTISTNMAGRGTDIKLGGSSEQEKQRVLELGGLLVIGTNKHETERIDRQLRGRAGRQGDPGSSKFFVSLKDNLMQKYRLDELLPPDMLRNSDDKEVDHPIVRREVARIQRICDGQNLEIKKTLAHYSDLLEKQRSVLFNWRQGALHELAAPEYFKTESPKQYETLLRTTPPETLQNLCTRLMLYSIDKTWTAFLADIADIREGIHLNRLGGKNPYFEFQKLSVNMFEEQLQQLHADMIERFESLNSANDFDPESLGIQVPTATWTYLINDNSFGNQLGLDLLGNMGMQVSAGILGPLVALQWLFRKRKKADSSSRQAVDHKLNTKGNTPLNG
ncbi:MAG: accessory Sec system translocase SecA2 [candidate division KSB1 bacterium]|nr:accessory Sec system translocase SecA2 [candidate division KSB1 bacterium]